MGEIFKMKVHLPTRYRNLLLFPDDTKPMAQMIRQVSIRRAGQACYRHPRQKRAETVTSGKVLVRTSVILPQELTVATSQATPK